MYFGIAPNIHTDKNIALAKKQKMKHGITMRFVYFCRQWPNNPTTRCTE
jgi:hypothetical protein